MQCPLYRNIKLKLRKIDITNKPSVNLSVLSLKNIKNFQFRNLETLHHLILSCQRTAKKSGSLNLNRKHIYIAVINKVNDG